MNNKITNFLKNMSYTFTSNLVSLVISTLVILIVPKLIGVQQYGYWQLYLFYTSYVGFLHLGWPDGLYLRIGGEEYEDLDKSNLFSQFISIMVLQLFLAILLWIVTLFLGLNLDRSFILNMTALVMIIVNPRIMLIFILQATNRIRSYALVTILDRMVYVVLTMSLLFLGVRDYRILILADIAGKVISLFYAMYFCREIVFNKFSPAKEVLSEIKGNIIAGSKLMFAGIASMLIIGIVRFGIEQTWTVETFGKVSLTLSISNMMMVFINAIGVMVFPILRRTTKENLVKIYQIIRDTMMPILLGLLLFYYPIKSLLSIWLPQYQESLAYMALLFPVFIFEGKTAILLNSYLKTLREEKTMLTVNVVTMLLSIVLSAVSTYYFENLDLTVLSITVLVGIKLSLIHI